MSTPRPPSLLSRRTILKGALAGAGVLSLTSCAGQDGLVFGPPLVEPKPAPRTADGEVVIEANERPYVLAGQTVSLRHYNDLAVGPVIRVRGGETLRLLLKNALLPTGGDYLCTATPDDQPDNVPHGLGTTNMHLHGLHVSPNSPADNILMMVKPGESYHYRYDIPADHPNGTYFYHAHFHGSVALQVSGGMAGPLIVEGPLDDIPEIKAARERILVLQSQRFDGAGRCDDYALLDRNGPTYVNGQQAPVISLQPGEVQRWRIINATHASFYSLQVAQHLLVGLCYDGNPLPYTQTTERLRLSPGNRADVLIKGGAPGMYALTGIDTQELIAWVRVEGPTQDMPLYQGSLPVPPELRPITDDEVTYGRRLTFGMTGAPDHVLFTINEQPFSCSDTWKIPLNAVEEWHITNQTADIHPFHIHVNPFQMLSGGRVPAGRWLDTVEIPPYQSIAFRTRFRTYTGTFVFHCHVLTHEDMGMMQGIEVV